MTDGTTTCRDRAAKSMVRGGNRRCGGTTFRPLRLTERHLSMVLAAVMLCLLAFFVRPLLLGQLPVHGDLGMLLLVFRDFYARCLCQGDAFDWMPQIFGGYDLTGGGACGTYHPLNWLLYRWLPLPVAFNCEVFLPIVVLAIEPVSAGSGILMKQVSTAPLGHSARNT